MMKGKREKVREGETEGPEKEGWRERRQTEDGREREGEK